MGTSLVSQPDRRRPARFRGCPRRFSGWVAEVRREIKAGRSGDNCEIRSASFSAAFNVEVVQEEHGCPCGPVGEFSRVWVLGDGASGCLILAIEDEGDDGSSGCDVSEG